MNIKSIEPTPSPNTMKINLTEELPAGQSNNYKKESAEQAPLLIQRLLQIEGIKGVYHVADFLAIERISKYDWKDLLIKVREVFGEDSATEQTDKGILETYGEVSVSVQQFKGIPMQIKLQDDTQEKRFRLPDLFIQAIAAAQKDDDNVVLLRKWVNYGVRYGDMDEIGEEVKDEIVAAFHSERLQKLITEAQSLTVNQIAQSRKAKVKLTAEMLDETDWQKRYAALEQMEDPTEEDIPLLAKALTDEKVSIRRLAIVYLGMIENKAVLPYLYKGLHDSNPSVRRTAGDCLSDIGFAEAMNEMAKALSDRSKLVRWRAAMFLYELGDESTLPALKQAEQDPEFEVAMQIKMAINRIENGEEAKGSVWKQMTEARQN